MKVKTIPSNWLSENGNRLDCNPYMGGAIEAKSIIRSLKDEADILKDLTAGHSGGIYNGPKFQRIYLTSEEHSVPFLTTTSMMQADISSIARLKKKDAKSKKLSFLEIKEGMILISCSGTVGRMTYAGKSLQGVWSNQDMLKVVADENKIGSGYLYAFLNSSFGIPLVLVGTYGAMILHIEPEHIENMPIPRLGNVKENEIDSLIKKSSKLRGDFQKNIDAATELLFSSAGLSDITPAEWHSEGPDIGDQIYLKSPRSIRALNFGGRFKRLIENLKSVPHKTLGEICQGGQLSRGVRFKRIDSSPEYGAQLIGQKQGFWSKPEGRWISKAHAPEEIFSIDEAVLIASQGTLGEREVFCRPIFVTGKWLEYAYSEHFLRIYPNDTELSGAYVFAFLRSETAFRCLRSMSIGSKQQDIHVGMLSELPIPLIGHDDKKAVEQLIRDAFKAKDLADEYESTAIAMVESGIKAAAKKN
ncbi:methylation-associated defense system restriction endonuclease subunit S MAD5 [Plesiomonas shigelloides]|uniref:methylation-associated defense system restriction endonuclease subunit S MAD5 n=1 Tax=Plesiomonas shigelloides TaxID=703 RepID=UPI00126287CD|nr:restriction endonuclease subunit S [Plesiomonas shigelloides]KAB7670173.1 restriction endonuclease subunit S [Plesiomonas shigelloides]